MAVAEESEVINNAVVLLAAAGVTQEWQLVAMEQSDLELILQQSTRMREYLATEFVVKALTKSAATPQSDGMRAMADTLRKVVKESKTQQKGKRKNPFDSDDEEDERPKFKVKAMLEEYGLDQVPPLYHGEGCEKGRSTGQCGETVCCSW